MAAATRSRRPLPPRVYWFRRLLVAGVALALVFGIARLLDYTTGDSEAEQATTVAASPTTTTHPHKKHGAADEADDKGAKGAKGEDGKKKDPLAQPDGPCADGDVVVTPNVSDAHAGSPVKIVLELTTVESAACYWEVSPDSVFVNIDEADVGTLWSSQQCPNAMPTESVVPRREKAAKVTLWWTPKESDEGCPVSTDWLMAGSYTAVAAAKGSVTPMPTGFVLGSPVAPTVTTTPTPTPTPSESPSEKPGKGSHT